MLFGSTCKCVFIFIYTVRGKLRLYLIDALNKDIHLALFVTAFVDFGYVNNGLMILPPMALILLGCIIWIQRSIQKDLQEK